MLGINLLFVMCVHKTSERYEDMFVDSTWQSPFVAMNIEYKDSVYYKGKVENLISLLFNEKGVLSVGLSYPEEKYLIYLLFHHGVYLNTDCETGVLYILNK